MLAWLPEWCFRVFGGLGFCVAVFGLGWLIIARWRRPRLYTWTDPKYFRNPPADPSREPAATPAPPRVVPSAVTVVKVEGGTIHFQDDPELARLRKENELLLEAIRHALCLCHCKGNGIWNAGCSCSDELNRGQLPIQHECTNVIETCAEPECLKAREILMPIFVRRRLNVSRSDS